MADSSQANYVSRSATTYDATAAQAPEATANIVTSTATVYQATGASVVTTDLVGEWVAKLATGSGPGTNSPQVTTWTDLIGDNDLTISNSDYTESNGWDGDGTLADPYCLHSGGVYSSKYGARATTATSDDLMVDTAWSVEQWFCAVGDTAAGNTPTLFWGLVVAPDYEGARFYFTTATERPEIQLGTGTTYVYKAFAPASPTGDFTKGTFYQLVATYNGTQLRCYLNGSLYGSATTTSYATSSTGIFRVHSGYIDGSTATIRYYSRALSDSEVLQNYNAGVLAASTSGAADHADANLVTSSPTVYQSTGSATYAATANYVERTPTVYQPTATAAYAATANLISRSATPLEATGSIGPMSATANLTTSAPTAYQATAAGASGSATANLVTSTPTVYESTGSESGAEPGYATAELVSRSASVSEPTRYQNDGIELERKDGDGEWFLLGRYPWDSSISDGGPGFAAGTHYYYRGRRFIVGWNGEPVYSEYSNTEDVLFLQGVANLVERPSAVYEATASVPDSITIERKVGDGEYEVVHYADWDDATWTDTGPFTAGVTYYYRAYRTTDAESSSYSNIEEVAFASTGWDVTINGDSTLTNNDWQQSAEANYVELTATVYTARGTVPAPFVEHASAVYEASASAHGYAGADAVLVDHDAYVYIPYQAYGKEPEGVGGRDYAPDPYLTTTRAVEVSLGSTENVGLPDTRVRSAPPADVEYVRIRVTRTK